MNDAAVYEYHNFIEVFPDRYKIIVRIRNLRPIGSALHSFSCLILELVSNYALKIEVKNLSNRNREILIFLFLRQVKFQLKIKNWNLINQYEGS